MTNKFCSFVRILVCLSEFWFICQNFGLFAKILVDNFRAVSPGGKSQDDKTTSEAEKSHQNGGKNGGNGSDKSMDLDDRSPSRHKSKKHKKFKQRSR